MSYVQIIEKCLNYLSNYYLQFFQFESKHIIQSNMPPKCSHDENRAKICAPCGQKIVLGKQKLESFSISSRYGNLIKTFVNPDFDIMDSRFAVSICVTCKLTLNEHENSNGDLCNFFICLRAKNKGPEKIVEGSGQKRNLSNKIDKSNGLFATVLYEKSATESENEIGNENEKLNSAITICNICFTTLIFNGQKHSCNKITARENVTKFLEKLPEKQQEQIGTTSLKRKWNEKGSHVSELSLSTKGSKLNVSLGKLKTHIAGSFSAESLDECRTTNGLSLMHMKKLTNLIRCNVGRKTVPPNILKHLSEKSKS